MLIFVGIVIKYTALYKTHVQYSMYSLTILARLFLKHNRLYMYPCLRLFMWLIRGGQSDPILHEQ